MSQKNYILAFDTANEIIAVGVGKLERETATIKVLASCETPAFRASNTKLIAKIDAALEDAGVAKSELACVACGRGPGSFTGVRICTATAKGIALGLDLPLFGVSTLDAQAWDQWAKGVRGEVVVLGDAMRKEVYPVRYVLNDEGPVRQNADFVIKAEAAKEWLAASAECQTITGDALGKFAELFAPFGTLAPESDWHPTGAGLLRCVEAAWRDGAFAPDDRALGNPLALLPVYTRLATNVEYTSDELRIKLRALLSAEEIDAGVIKGAILCSVVPALTHNWEKACERSFGVAPQVVSARSCAHLLNIDKTSFVELGADRVADAVAAKAIFGAPVVVVDFGTATNMEVIDKDGVFVGGVIAPGVESSMRSLMSRAALLRAVELEDPGVAIGRDSSEAIQIGVVSGEAARVDGLVERIQAELGYKTKVVATGGLAHRIAPLSHTITEVDVELTLQGLRLIYNELKKCDNQR